MNLIVKYFNLTFEKSSIRTQNLIKQIFGIGIINIFSMIISFILVPLSIKYLGTEEYGLWLTIFSFVGWFTFFDFGIGHGLRNKLAENIASGNIERSKSLISTAYFSIGMVSVIMAIVFFVISNIVNWELIFKYYGDVDLKSLILLVFIIFSFNLVFKIISVIFLADQKPLYPALFKLLAQLILLVTIYFALETGASSLLFYGGVVLGSQLLVFLVVSIIVFSGLYYDLKPELKYFDKKYIKDIMDLGGKFLFIQVNAILIFSTDNFVINYFLGPDQVTVYNVVFKYFSIVAIGIGIVFNPYWSAFTSAITLKEYSWIRSSMKNLFRISLFSCLVIIVMVFISDKVYSLWIGEMVKIPFMLTVLVGVGSIIMVLKQPAVILINGSGLLKNQIIVSSIAALVNVPLSIVLVVNFNLGVYGVVIATILAGLLGLFVYNIQVYKMVYNEKYF